MSNAGAEMTPDEIAAVPRGGRLPASAQQRYLWFLQQLDPASPAYNVSHAVRLRGPLDAGALREALRGLVARHESLRTRFGDDAGVPCQVIEPAPSSWPLPAEPAEAAALTELTAAEAARPFDLARGPVFRSRLLRLGSDDHVLLLSWHHIVTDGWSGRHISEELTARYSAALAGRDPGLAAPAIQPADFAAWQHRWLAGEDAADQVDFWRQALEGAPPLEFPSDRPRPARATGAGAILTARLPDELSRELREFAADEGVPLMAVLLAAFQVVLSRYTGQQDLVTGSLLPGRTLPELDQMVGFFVATVVLRASLARDPAFRDLTLQCADLIMEAAANQDVPFGTLVEALKPDRVPGVNPLFQILFTMLPDSMQPCYRFEGLQARQLRAQVATSRFDMSVQVDDEDSGGLGLYIEYSTELYDTGRIERLVAHFQACLESALARPDAGIESLDILPAAERELLVTGWNPVPSGRDGTLLHDLVARRAAQAPAATAMRFAGTELSYRELEERSGRLARHLAAHGVAPGTVVGVLLERGLDLPVAELAVLKAGGAWLPLDPQYPPDRLAYQLGDAGAAVAVTTPDLAGLLPGEVTPVLAGLAGQDPPPVRLARAAGPEAAAYVIYTSGSTGRPKGVLVPHRAVVNFCAAFRELFGVSGRDRILQFANPAFDVSVSDIFATLAAGATIVGAPRQVLIDPAALQELMAAEGVTFADIPPAVLRLLDPGPLDALRALFIGMEPFGPELVNSWARPGREFHNGYGPTEATITCVDYRCPDEPLTAQPPIGRAMANQRAYVLDHRMRLSPVGVPGQLYLAGDGLARGYIGNPGLTADKFRADPWAASPGDRMYSTGDLVRWRADGNLEFLGRTDRQVKIRGLRVEPGEIEHVLAGYPGIRQAAVVVKDPGTPQARLVGYLVPAAGTEIGLGQVREYAGGLLAPHMVPAALVSLDALPLTSSGKVDTARLPDPRPAAGDAGLRTGTQRRLAAIWQDLLGPDTGQVGALDSFFAIGGSSLQVTQLISRIRDGFGVSLQPRDLFACPVLEQLAARIEQAQIDEALRAAEEAASAPDASPIAAAPRTGPLPCTYQQEGLWFLSRVDPSSPAYHITFAGRLRGPLDIPALRAALTALVTRHESLRTRFDPADGVPVQVIDPPPGDWPLEPEPLEPDEAGAWLDRQSRQPFDLAAGPVLRASLARTGPAEHLLLLVTHHIVSDGWSMSLLADELSALYGEAAGGPPAGLGELTVQAADHAVWQRRWLSGPRLRGELAYWREALEDLPVLEFPADHPRPDRPTGAGRYVNWRLPDELAGQLRELARAEQVSFLAVLLAVFATVLGHWTGQQDLAIGSVFAGRTRTETEPLIGFFANTLVLRTRLDGDPSFRELIRRCHETVLSASAHQDVPFRLVVEALRPPRLPGRNPLFQVAFTLQAAGVNSGLALRGLDVSEVPLSSGRARFDFAVIAVEQPGGGLEMVAEYSTELYDPSRVERLAEDFRAAAQRLARGPGARALAPDPPALVPIQPAGTRPPLFLVHAVAGSVTPYYPLARMLGDDQPCYGLEHPGLRGGRWATRLPDIAASYLAAIRQARPSGPYLLGGWSYGGVLAAEMACQLQAAGEQAALVFALDSGLPDGSPEPDQAELLSQFARDLAGLTGSEALDPAELRQLPEHEQIDVALARAGQGMAASQAELRTRIGIFLSSGRAFWAYRPGSCAAPLLLVTTTDADEGTIGRWRAMAAGEFAHHAVPGTHYTLLRPPDLAAVAGLLRQRL